MKFTGLQLQLEGLRVKHAFNKPVRKMVMAARLAAMLPGMFARNGLHYSYNWFLLRYGPASKNYSKSRARLESLLNIWIEKQGSSFLGLADVSKLPEDRSTILDECDRALKNFPGTLALEYDECLDFYHYFLFFGDLRIAARFREFATRIILREQEQCSHLLPEALKAALELGQAEDVLEWLEKKNSAIIDPDLREALTAHAHALTGSRAEALRYWESRYSPEDRKYADYLRGKSIAIVGPAPPDGEPGAEIDSFDIVIRTNFNTSKVPDARLFGSRTDVSYYNHSTMVESPESIYDAAEHLDWLNLKVPDAGIERDVSSSGKSYGIRTFFVPETILQLGYPNTIPCILFDLFAGKPQRIKLFGVNFFASANAYSAHYAQSSANVAGASISRGLRMHDPFSQLYFVKSLLNRHLIAVDELGALTLGMSLPDYAANLESLYGAWHID